MEGVVRQHLTVALVSGGLIPARIPERDLPIQPARGAVRTGTASGMLPSTISNRAGGQSDLGQKSSVVRRVELALGRETQQFP